MTLVVFRFLDIGGTPLANATVEIHLSEQETGYISAENGLIVPSDVSHQTDDAGELTVELAPSDALYHAVVRDPGGLGACAYYSFRVPVLVAPDTSVRLQDILVAETAPGNSILNLLIRNAGQVVNGLTEIDFVGFSISRVGNTLVITAPTSGGTPGAGSVYFDGGATFDGGVLWS